ncbi:PREDICTED: seipin-3-like [Tarenaya hassleriana]|uniref:seipin-3-like n=1 Tax=Tarenaya hassleriana TaxID=28532 RepID=UPI00053C1230|nr:PREDICTED: seipin-3-like [Tarenaya hassleriana]
MGEIDDFSNGFGEFSGFSPDFGDSKSGAFGDAVKCFLLSFVADGAEKAMKTKKCRRRHDFPSLSRENLGNAGFGSRARGTEEENCYLTKRVPTRTSNLAIVEPEFQNPITDRPNSEIITPNLPDFLVRMTLKLITFQLNLAVSFFTFPIWASYLAFSLAMFPFYTVSQIKSYITRKLQEAIENFIFRFHRSVTRLGRALFWAGLVGLALAVMLILGFVFGGVMVKFMVEKPLMVKESLHFDYTMRSPTAVVALSSPETATATARRLGYNQKVSVEVSLTVPESEYNRKLGVFQVRIEFISANGKVSESASYPCMLWFKSKPIRLVETAIRTAPLLAGLQSETQTLHVKADGFKEGLEPTTSVKISLDERAASTGGGIPEVYSATMLMESASPRLRKMLWLWRFTVFVWTSFAVFCTELVAAWIFLRRVVARRNKKMIVISGTKGPKIIGLGI